MNFNLLKFKQMQSKWQQLPATKRDRIAFLAFATTLILLTVLLYSRFIFGDALFIFAGSASDSIGQTIPFVLNEASRLESGDISNWNQFQFLGATTIQFLNPDYLPSLFGASAVPLMMLISQMMKVILAGIFFYFYLGYLQVCKKTRFIIALGFAFCGRMIELAPWTAYTIEVTFAAGILWGLERFLSDNRKVLVLPVMLAGVGMSLGLYGLVLYILILIMYAIFRIGYIWNSDWNAAKALALLAKLLVLIIAGVAISLPVTLPSILSYANSARVSSNLSFVLNPAGLLKPSSLAVLAEEVVKFFSTGILGHMNSYNGSLNILNSPYFYTGLLAVSAAPLAFRNKTKRERGWLTFIIIAAVIYLYSDGFRLLLNGFSVPGSDFRQSSFWIVLVTCVLGAYGLDTLWTSTTSRHYIISSATAFTLFFASVLFLKDHISVKHAALIAFLLLAYTTYFIILARINSSSSAAPIGTRTIVLYAGILALVVCETFLQNYAVIKNSGYLTRAEYQMQLGSDPEEAVLEISDEREDTYRIDYKTLLLTRPMASTYLGTQSYIGGAGFNQQITDFLTEVGNDYVEQLGYTRYVYGFNEDALNSLLGVRYLIYPNNETPYYVPFGYNKVNETSDYIAYENQYALPLIYAYGNNETMSRDELNCEARCDRDLAMLDSVVLNPDQITAENTDLATELPRERNNRAETVLAATNGSVRVDEPLDISLRETDMPWISFTAQLDATSTASGCLEIKIDFYNADNELITSAPYLTAAGNERIAIEVPNDGFSHVTISFSHINACADPVLSDIQLSACDESHFDAFSEAVERRSRQSAILNSYHAGSIDATIDIETDGILASSIPYDPSWNLYIDGIKTETFPVNIGFVGSKISKGSHTIKMTYDETSSCISMIAFGVTIAILGIIEVHHVIYDAALESRKKLSIDRE